MYIKGVNLGNWLVLEKWMSPALFDGTTAEDEYNLPRQLSPGVYEARIRVHRSEYITERDFAAIRRMGCNAVRIPVPYFVFGDRPPFIGCVDELDRAFGWAERYGMKVLIDLHTAPMGQNGFDNGGICGVCRWSQLPEEVDFVLDVLERLARRYGHRPGLLGITPINEPITDPVWSLMDVPNRYRAADPELAAGSAPNTMDFLRDFYARAYARIRPNIAPDRFVVFHDAFRLKDWRDFVTRPEFSGVMLDTHMYLMMAEAMGCPQTPAGYLGYIRDHFAADVAEVQRYVPVIVGEWCLFNSAATGMDTQGGRAPLNGQAAGTGGPEDTERAELYRAVASAQLEAWKGGAGHFYWSYKLLLDTVNDASWRGWDCWDAGKSADLGWLSLK